MSRFPLVVLLATLASTAALAIPAMAGAAIAPPVVEGNVLTVNGDGAEDTVVLTVDGGVLVVNGTATALVANDAAEVVVDAGGGRDAVDASALGDADYGTMQLHGGDENDVLAGGDGIDELFGDVGDDRLIGFGAADQVRGGQGNDAMVWNDGDGADRHISGLGIDESEINGSPIARDFITYNPDPGNVGEVLVVIENTDNTQVQLDSEQLTINGLGGPDRIESADEAATISEWTLLTLIGGGERDILLGDAGPDVAFGGTGSDDIVLRGGADRLNGGDGDDILFGQDGDDHLIGDRGDDFLNGEAGDDVLVWNDRDGSDEFEGAAGFDRAEFNGAPAAGDMLSLAGGIFDTTLRRANLGTAVVEFVSSGLGNNRPHGGIEAVSVDGLGGDDTFTVAAGIGGLLVSAQGGTGNDVLEGSEEEDTFLGGPGGDTIDPGAGSDLIDGQEGDDGLSSRDGIADLVRGGAGDDSATTDAANVDAVDGVEELDALPVDDPPVDPPVRPETPVQPPAGDTRALLPQLGKVSLRPGFGAPFARIPLFCPAAEAGGCATTLTLQTAAAVRLGKVKAPLVLGSKGTRLLAGQRTTVMIRLAPGADKLARAGFLRVRLRLESSDAAGNSAATEAVVRLSVPAPLRERP